MQHEELLPNYRKPEGEAGRTVIEKMYAGHDSITRPFIDLLAPTTGDVALDVGCGGGLALSLMASTGARAYGIDYSEVSVEAAREYNREAVRDGRVTVEQADVLGMPFADGKFTLVTAIETVYFWDRIDDCYARIHRAMKSGGRFAILVEAWRDGDRVVNEPERLDILKLSLFSPDDFTADLAKAGFADVRAQVITDRRCLCVTTVKP